VSARLTPTGLALAAIVVLGAVLRFTGLSDQSIWADELFTVNVVEGGGFWEVPSRVAETEAAPAPYYMLAWVWGAVFGLSDADYRSLTALLGTITIPVVYLAVKELSSKRAALIAAALCACSPILVWYSQEVRVYALYVLFVAASFWLFARALNDGRDRVLVAWTLVSAAAIASYYLAAIPVLLEAAVLLWTARDRRGHIVVAVAAVLVTIGAQLPYALDHSDQQSWIGYIAPVHERMEQTLELFLVGNSSPIAAVVIGAAIVVLGAGVALVLWGEAAQRRAAGIAFGIGALGLAVAAAGRLFDADYVLGRNMLFAWVPLACAFAIALGTPRLRVVGPLAAAVVCALGVWLVVDVKRDDDLQRADYRAVAEAIDSRPRQGVRAILAPSAFQSMVLVQYLRAPHATMATIPPPADELVLVGADPPDIDGCWWGGMCAIPQPEVPASVSGFRVVERIPAGPFSLLRLRARRPRLPEVTIGTDAGWYVQAPALYP
jgi:hypothetical protein